jgi:hypothetical protein
MMPAVKFSYMSNYNFIYNLKDTFHMCPTYNFMAKPMYNLEIDCRFSRVDQSAPYRKIPCVIRHRGLVFVLSLPECKP